MFNSSVLLCVQHLSRLKLDFIRIVCDHEHFVPLNLPFPKSSESVIISMATTRQPPCAPPPADGVEYSLTDNFCRKHFLVGLLLREVSMDSHMMIM